MSMIDSFNELSQTGKILVGGAGNEGNTDIHYSGNINMSDKSQDIIIQVGEQLNLDITLCPVGPDKIGAFMNISWRRTKLYYKLYARTICI